MGLQQSRRCDNFSLQSPLFRSMLPLRRRLWWSGARRTCRVCLYRFQKTHRFAWLQDQEIQGQPPAKSQIMLGVSTSITTDHFITEILKTRRQQMIGEIKTMFHDQIVTSKQAQTLAGKSVFTNASTFGALGAAALRPLYRRTSYAGKDIDTDINASLHLMTFLLNFAPPKVTPLVPLARRRRCFTRTHTSRAAASPIKSRSSQTS